MYITAYKLSFLFPYIGCFATSIIRLILAGSDTICDCSSLTLYRICSISQSTNNIVFQVKMMRHTPFMHVCYNYSAFCDLWMFYLRWRQTASYCVCELFHFHEFDDSSNVVCDVIPYGPVEFQRCFPVTFCLHLQRETHIWQVPSKKMEPVYLYKIPASIYHTKRCHNPG